MIAGCDIQLEEDYFTNREYYNSLATTVIYTGMIDEFYDYRYGTLEYRSLGFEHECLDEENYQGNAVVNYTDKETPYTRIIEHKHFEFSTQSKTIITKEYPTSWDSSKEPYYPVNDHRNSVIYEQYSTLAKQEKNVVFGGRLAEYKYYDMHHVIERAIALAVLLHSEGDC